MSGLPKQAVYEYRPLKNGKYKFSKSYGSIKEYREANYPNDKGARPFFCNKLKMLDSQTEILKNGNIISLYRVGTDGIRKLLKIYNNPFKRKGRSTSKYRDKRIGMFNVAGEKIAEFYDLDVAAEILKINKEWIRRSTIGDSAIEKLHFVKFKFLNKTNTHETRQNLIKRIEEGGITTKSLIRILNNIE